MTYDVDLQYANASTRIIIAVAGGGATVADFTINDDTYPRGQFGTFDYSQIRACNGPWTSDCL